MKTLSKYTKVLIGYNNEQPIYLSPPSWDCDWYWGFGYLGNRDCHYHVDTMEEKMNMHDAFIKHFGETLTIRNSEIWTFAELFKTFYVLKETAEVLGRGGTHLTSNPCKDLIINKEEVTRINNIVLPQIFEEIYKILYRNKNNKKLFEDLVSINLKGNTMKVVEFMKENNFHTDDLKIIKELTKDDFNNIHSYYWKDFHKNKN